MAKIKLLEVKESLKNIRRFQSQLHVGRDTIDFIMEDGVMKCHGRGENGFDFYLYDGDYEIVQTKKEMEIQEL